jgi:hypothetical protein
MKSFKLIKFGFLLIFITFFISSCSSLDFNYDFDEPKARSVCDNLTKLKALESSWRTKDSTLPEQRALLDSIKSQLLELSSVSSNDRPKRWFKVLSTLETNGYGQLEYFCGEQYIPGSRDAFSEKWVVANSYTIEEYLGQVPDPRTVAKEEESPVELGNNFDFLSRFQPLLLVGLGLIYLYLVHRFAKWVAGTASRAGRSFQGWYVISLIAPVLAAIVVLTFPKSTARVAEVKIYTKVCPMCAEEVKFEAQKCRYCQHMFE